VALGGDCLSDLSEVRAEPGLYGPVASDPTVSRLIALLGADAERAEKAISRARKAARARVWALAGPHAPNSGITAADPLIIDVDATLVTAHSDKEQAAPTFKKGYGHHPLCAFIDHGAAGSGEMAAVMLRPGNAGSNTAADHTTVIRAALDQAGVGSRPGRKVLVRMNRCRVEACLRTTSSFPWMRHQPGRSQISGSTNLLTIFTMPLQTSMITRSSSIPENGRSASTKSVWLTNCLAST
jgi:hypothetical protein